MGITTTITQKGQITIPIAIRKLLGLKAFDKLIFSVQEEKIVATPISTDILSLYGSVKSKRPLDFKKVRRKMMRDLSSKIVTKEQTR